MKNYLLKISCCFLIYVRRVRNIRAKRKLNIRLTKVSDLVSKIYNDDSDICHIIASGSSVLDTISIINDKDTVIGFNFSALMPIKFDLYLIESASRSYNGPADLMGHDFPELTTKAQSLLIDNLKEDHPECKVILKNILSPMINMSEIQSQKHLYIDFFLDELNICGLGRFYENNKILCLQEMLFGEYDFILQSETSALTAINIAIKTGFKKIIIHGMDGGGNHFYNTQEFSNNMISGKNMNVLNILLSGMTESDYSTAVMAGSAAREYMQQVRKILSSKGVELDYANNIIDKKLTMSAL